MTQRSLESRLIRMEDNQQDFIKSIDKIFERLDKQDEKLDIINKNFDELTGAKKVLFALTAVMGATITAVATYLGIHHK